MFMYKNVCTVWGQTRAFCGVGNHTTRVKYLAMSNTADLLVPFYEISERKGELFLSSLKAHGTNSSK
jgi:hypothetical protein